VAPTLQNLVSELQARKAGEVFRIVELMSRFIPDFASEEGDGREWPAEASVSILPVRQGKLFGAILEVVPKGHQRCSKGDADRRKVHWLSVWDYGERKGFIRVSKLETDAFDTAAPSPRVVFPKVAAGLLVFTVESELTSSNRCRNGVGRLDEELVEVFSVRFKDGEPDEPDGAPNRFERFVASSHESEPGQSEDSRTSLDWIVGRTQMSYLGVTVKRTLVFFATGPDDDSKPRYECSLRTKVYSLSRDGEFSQVDDLQSLRTEEPALARLPKDGTGDTRKECDALEDAR